MTDAVRQRILSACYRLLLPIARALLANGIGYREFDEVCRQAFVQTASRRFGVRSRETNNSRVAAMTGIPRKQVQEIKKAMTIEVGEAKRLLSPLADLMHLWATAEEYQDDGGQPLTLKMHGGNGRSFETLVQTCMGDVPSGAVKAELLRLGTIAVSSNDELVLKRRSLIPEDAGTRLESAIVYSLRALADTVAHNSDPNIDKSDRLFERFVESRPMSDSDVDYLRAAVRERLTEVSEELDYLLNSRPLLADETTVRRVGIGLYYSE